MHRGALAYDARSMFSGVPVIPIAEWLDEQDLVSLYDSCDILLHPYRGGAFELNPFEALARGLPVIVTGWGSILDYANIHNAYLISPKSAIKTFPLAVSGHIGYGVNPDVDHCVELLEWCIENLEYCKRKAEKQRGEFVQRSWEKSVEQFLKGCREVWATR